MGTATNTLAQKAYDILLERIVSTQYYPGSVLNEAGLVDDLGISRTPIHAACIQLNQENLIEFLPKKGMRVTPIDAEVIREIHDIRDLIEPYAIACTRKPIPKEKLLRYMDIFGNDDIEKCRRALYAFDTELHMDIIAQTDNAFLCDYYKSMQPQFERISNLCGEANQNRRFESNKEHLAIITALLQDDIPAAKEAMQMHLKRARESAYRCIVIEPNQKHKA